MADRPPEGPAPTEPDDAPVLPSRQQTPRTVGPYRLLQQLGEGGMGIVFAGHDDRLDRGVAIKMICRSDAQPLARERFLREAQAAASVSHPNICPIFEIGEEAGELFIVMELLEGEPLSARLARGPLPVAEAVPLALAMTWLDGTLVFEGPLPTLSRIVEPDLARNRSSSPDSTITRPWPDHERTSVSE